MPPEHTPAEVVATVEVVDVLSVTSRLSFRAAADTVMGLVETAFATEATSEATLTWMIWEATPTATEGVEAGGNAAMAAKSNP